MTNLDDFKLTAVQATAMGGWYHLDLSIRQAREMAEEAGDAAGVALADRKLQILGEIQDRRTGG